MCSLPMSLSDQSTSQQAFTSFFPEIPRSKSSFGGSKVLLNLNGKPYLHLDMNKVAEVDDTIVVVETELDEDSKSADEFK